MLVSQMFVNFTLNFSRRQFTRRESKTNILNDIKISPELYNEFIEYVKRGCKHREEGEEEEENVEIPQSPQSIEPPQPIEPKKRGKKVKVEPPI